MEDARANVLSQIHPLASLQLPLTEAYGCVAAENLVADRDLPEFASSAMDGFAVRSSDVAGASPARPIELKIVGSARIGRRPDAVVGGGEAVRIATGAPIPAGADTVVPIENAEPGGEMATIFDGPPAGQHIRPSGEDVKAGQVLVPSGKRLGPPEMGLLANAGFPHPHVHPRPRVIVLSTGDELIPPTETPEFGQVRDSNAYMIFSALRDVGAQPVLAGIVKDDVDALKDTVIELPDPGRRVHLVGRCLRRRARRGEGGVLPPRRRRLLQGGDAARHAPGVRPDRGQAVLRPAGQPRERVRAASRSSSARRSSR